MIERIQLDEFTYWFDTRRISLTDFVRATHLKRMRYLHHPGGPALLIHHPDGTTEEFFFLHGWCFPRLEEFLQVTPASFEERIELKLRYDLHSYRKDL